MIDRFTLWFARFALAVLASRFNPAHRRVWVFRVDPYLKPLTGEADNRAAEVGIYFGDPDLARRGLKPVFSMIYTDEMLTGLAEHVRTAREMRDTMRQG